MTYNYKETTSVLRDPVWLQARIDEGHTYDHIAELAGCSRPLVMQWVRRLELTKTPRPDLHHKLLSDYNWLEERVEQGVSISAIVREADTSHTSVRAWLHQHGLRERWEQRRQEVIQAQKAETHERYLAGNRKPPKYPKLRDLEWLQRELNYRTMSSIAEEIGCHLSSVSRVISRKGLHYDHRIAIQAQALSQSWARDTTSYLIIDQSHLKDYVVAAMRDGFSATATAQAFEIPYHRALEWAHEAGVTKGRGRPTQKEVERGLPSVAHYAKVAHMSDTSTFTPSTPPAFTQPSSIQFERSDPPRSTTMVRGDGFVAAFKAHLRANPGVWYAYPEVKTGGLGISNGSGFTFTTRSRAENGDYNITASGKRGVKVWGRYDAPQA